MYTKLRFAEKNTDKTVINSSNKPVDNLGYKKQVHQPFDVRIISNLDRDKVKYFSPTAQLTLLQQVRKQATRRHPRESLRMFVSQGKIENVSKNANQESDTQGSE